MKRKSRAYKNRVNSLLSINRKCPLCNSKMYKIIWEKPLSLYEMSITTSYRCKSSYYFNNRDTELCNFEFSFGWFNEDIQKKEKLLNIYLNNNSIFNFYSGTFDVYSSNYTSSFDTKITLKEAVALYNKYIDNICLM